MIAAPQPTQDATDSTSPATRIEKLGRSLTAAGCRSTAVLLATARDSLIRAVKAAILTVGFSLMISPDGLHAVMSAVRDQPEIILLDSSLSGVDVDTVEAMLRRDARTTGIPILRIAGVDEKA